MEYILRKATENDAVRIKELFIEMLRTIYNTDEVDGYPDGYLDKYFDGEKDQIIVATDDDKVIAYLSVEVHRDKQEHYIYLDDFSVTKDYRGSGIGTMLIKNAETYAHELKVSNIYLHVEKSNASAYKLYEKLGYSINEDLEERYLLFKNVDI